MRPIPPAFILTCILMLVGTMLSLVSPWVNSAGTERLDDSQETLVLIFPSVMQVGLMIVIYCMLRGANWARLTWLVTAYLALLLMCWALAGFAGLPPLVLAAVSWVLAPYQGFFAVIGMPVLVSAIAVGASGDGMNAYVSCILILMIIACLVMAHIRPVRDAFRPERITWEDAGAMRERQRAERQARREERAGRRTRQV